MAMTLYDVMTERRRAFRDMFSAMKEWAEPTEREKMAQQHIMDMEKMSEQAKINLNADMIKMTRAFGETMALRGIDFDNDIMKMGITAYEDRLKADMKYQRDLELARLDIQARKTAAEKLRGQQLSDEKIERERKDQDEYMNYLSAGPGMESRLLASKYASTQDLYIGDDIWEADLDRSAFKDFSAEAIASFVQGGSATAAAVGIFGQLGPQALVPEELITMPAAFMYGGFLSTIKGIDDFRDYKDAREYDIPKTGWTGKGALDAAFTGRKEGKINDKIRKEINAKVDEKNDSGEIKKADRDDIFLRLTHQDFEPDVLIAMYGSGWREVTTEQGVQKVQTISPLTKEIDMNIAVDFKRGMAPFIGTEELAETEALKLRLPATKAAKDGSPMFATYRQIQDILEGDLSKANLIVVKAIGGDAKYKELLAIRESYLAKQKMYDDYFERANNFAKEHIDDLANYSQIQGIVDANKAKNKVYVP